MSTKVILLLADVLAILCLSRCLLQWGKLDGRHPLAQFCTYSTDWLVKPLRKVTPPLGRWDMACVLASFVLYYLIFLLVWLLSSPQLSSKIIAALLLFTTLSVLKAAAYVLLLGLIIRMLISFQNPYSPLLAVLHHIFQPFSQPFNFLKIGRYDFSASVLVVALWFWLSVILPQLMLKLNIWLLY